MGREKHQRGCKKNALGQCSPTFLAPGTSFMEDNFSTDGGGLGDGSGGNVSHGEQQMKLRLLACHSPPAVRPGS